MKNLLIFLLISTTSFAQNKKEQIEILNFRVDSLNNVLSTARITFSDSLDKERTKSSQQKLVIDQQQKEIELATLQSKNLNSQINDLTKEEVLLKKEIQDLKSKQQELNKTEIQSFTLIKNAVDSWLMAHFKKILFKYPEIKPDSDYRSNSELTECQIWWQDDDAYALVVVREIRYIKEADWNDEIGTEISLNYYVLKYNNGKFEKEYNWCEKVDACHFDSENNNINFQITDLNKDGKLEVWCVNENYCKSDVSPNELVVYMYENGNIYVMKSVTNIPKMEITDAEIKEWIKDGNTAYSINQFDSKFESISDQYKQYAIIIRNENLLGEDRFNFVLE
jgi:hypothetical protein